MEAPPVTAAVRVLPRIPHPSSSSLSFIPSSSSTPPPHEGIVAVGFIGSRSSTDPAHLINRILDSNTFGSGRADRDLIPGSDWFAHRRVSYHHDSVKGLVYLQFSSCFNSFEDLSLSELEDSELEDLKCMFFMFSVCHIIIFIHEGTQLNTKILNKFRVLQSSKHSLLPCIKSQTNANSSPQSSHLAPHGSLSGRHLSTPVILFVFEDTFSDAINKKRLISSLESQIRFLVKKLNLSSRVSGNSNYTPLFSLDTSRSISLLDYSTNQKGEPLNYILDLINSGGSNLLNENNEEVQVIRDFISRHSEILKSGISKSGNSNPGNVAAAAIAAATSAGTVKSVLGFVLPVFDNWLNLSKSLLNALIGSKNDDENNNNDIDGVLCNLEKSSRVNAKFSVSWCEKALPVCTQVYLKDLPKHYRTSIHKEQLKKALELFSSMVKGPAINEFKIKLEKNCNFIWENGRQQCDETSLTGRPCIHKKHEGDLVISHCSGFYFLHACPCGRSRALRDDPFDLEMGHESFNASFKCEKLVPNIEIPTGTNGIFRLVRIGNSKYYDPQKGILQTGFCAKEKFLVPWVIKRGVSKETDNEFNSKQKISEHLITKKPFAEVVKNGSVVQIGSNIVPVVHTKNTGTKENNYIQEFVVYIGFEHECPFGHRFLLSEQNLKQLDSPVDGRIRNFGNKRGVSAKLHHSNSKKQSNQLSATSDNDNNSSSSSSNNSKNTKGEFSILTRKLPIFMNCPHCNSNNNNNNRRDLQKIRFAGTVSQLQRIFIVTPEFPVLLATCPVVQFEDSCLPESILNREKESQFGFGSRVLLPPDSFLTLKLPFIYRFKTGDGSFYPFNPFETRPDKTAWLVEGTTLQLVSLGNCAKEE